MADSALPLPFVLSGKEDISLPHFFCGQWYFERTIQPQNLLLKGTTHLSSMKENILLYEESGTYMLGNKLQDFYQTRFLEFSAAEWKILKSNFDVLHTFEHTPIHYLPAFWSHTHTCGVDAYHVRLTLHNHGHFSTFYCIEGPKKEYTISTDYYRQS